MRAQYTYGDKLAKKKLPRVVQRSKRQTGKSNVSKDKERGAMAPGKRLSKNNTPYTESQVFADSKIIWTSAFSSISMTHNIGLEFDRNGDYKKTIIQMPKGIEPLIVSGSEAWTVWQ